MERIYRFSAETTDWKSSDEKLSKKVLGGKGAGLAMMCQKGFPVPPGFTITTDNCNAYRALSPGLQQEFLDALMKDVMEQLAWLVDQFGYAPLVSVRSGAPISMPGMMDTILNVGMTLEAMPSWETRMGARATLDSRRRLIQMLGHTAFGVDDQLFEKNMTDARKSEGVATDAELSANALAIVCKQHEAVFLQATNEEFPATYQGQLRAAIKAVFDSWMNPRAIEYRKLNKIDESMGTAVNVQAMVFGNMGDTSGSGVLFTRNPSTGEAVVMAEYLTNAQGEDVVAGIRTPEKLEVSMTGANDLAWVQDLAEVCEKLEDLYLDMVDVEFTVQEGKLFILQSRTGKRSAKAAFKIAVDLVDQGMIQRETALKRLTPEQFKVLRRPAIDAKFKTPAAYTGLPACPGVASGRPVFSSKDAVAAKDQVILVTHETTPDDIAGMAAAVGILTQTGGATSHAAVVARAMDKTCVVGCTKLDMKALKSAKKVTIDGSTGRVWVDVEVPVADHSDAPELQRVISWCFEKGGMARQSAFPRDAGADLVVTAASWWGAEDVLDAVLDKLCKLPSLEKVCLDWAAPQDLMPASDSLLSECFGVASDDKFQKLIEKKVKARKELAGLQAGVLGTGVPADYAAFALLGK